MTHTSFIRFDHLDYGLNLVSNRNKFNQPLEAVIIPIHQTRGPWATIRSPEWNSHCISADARKQSSSTATATRTEIWQCRKKLKDHSRIIIWTNLVDLASPMLYTKNQPQSFLGSGEEVFEVFFYIYGYGSILFNSAKPFEQIVSTTSTEGPMRNLLKLAPQGMKFWL